MRAFSALLLVAAALMAMGCEGERGPTGPAGNANVVTGTISPTNEEWLWNSIYCFQTTPMSTTVYFSRFVDIPVEEITPEIMSTGVVLVFFEPYPGSGRFTPLPFQFVESNGDYIFNIVYEVMAGNIRLHFFSMLNSAGAVSLDLETYTIATYTFNYTVIAGTALQAMVASEVDLADHDRVMEFIAGQ